MTEHSGLLIDRLIGLLGRLEEERSNHHRPAGEIDLSAPDDSASEISARQNVRDIGWALYQAGGFSAMKEVCDLIEDGPGGDSLSAQLDYAWDGVGTWTA